MIPGMDPRMIKQAMKKLGMKQEEIDAKEVIIRTADKNLIIKNPEVIKVNMGGNETFQITGEVSEESNEDDLKMIIEQVKCSKEDAQKALEESDGDLAEAILKLQK